MKTILTLTTAAAVSFAATGLAQAESVTQSASGLEPLVGLHYEGWSIIGGAPVSTGRWNIQADGSVVSVNEAGDVTGTLGTTDSFVSPVSANHANSTAYVLTLEPNGDTDAGPSKVHIVAGRYEGNTAQAVVENRSAIGTDFVDFAGSFILAAPTGGADDQGLWYFNGESAALTLPELPEGWNYEGWVVDTAAGVPYSTGIFHDPNGADWDGAGPYAGPNADNFPPAPGQDFVQGMPLDLDNGNFITVISVEPADDADPAPFAIKILTSDIITGNGDLKTSGAPLTPLPTLTAVKG